VRVSGLEPGEHGVHIHETGQCGADFAAAGGHFNPTGRGHGFSTAGGAHGGDLPNIFVGADGTAAAHFLNDRVTLTDGPNSLFDADGAALIVHAKADTYGEDAGAGSRVACGVIEPGS
jgi:Cu-Zn family superoxide dismutase